MKDKIKEEMKVMYLEGTPIKKIGEKFGLQWRTVYKYLEPLSAEDKIIHLQKSLER